MSNPASRGPASAPHLWVSTAAVVVLGLIAIALTALLEIGLEPDGPPARPVPRPRPCSAPRELYRSGTPARSSPGKARP